MQSSEEPADELVDAVMTASRALLAVVVRSLAAVDEDVTLPQYRALVVLAQRGRMRPAELATALAVTPPTCTRMCGRLETKGLVVRERPADDRRAVDVSLSEAGRDLVEDVSRRRRDELRTLLADVPPARRAAVVEGLRSLADAAGEVPEPEWALGRVTP
ncbi:MarR family transcriptional regulator [Actinomycetospora sp. NBRC 106375]|uniref:MarR family winged helix-turn-helix transcriptional regulator n=1 Tax=Actinomycetospora sp. NBRC 106375 TaxID=3032207 RepID=UPI0024A4CB31|nr:MarR family transcriptional regulator [Actinomycetospora sp. NBRC 106375]GLZ48333.1 MarR family transcriptional regulator [Actinomycetospora sp. NBRC 106375]